MAFAIVNLDTARVIPQRKQTNLTFGSLNRVDLPDSLRSVVMPGHVGYELTPFKVYPVTVVDVGSGPVVANTSDPVFDPVADTVTVTRTLEAAPPPPTNDEIYDEVLQNQKVFKAYVLAINDGSVVPGSGMSGAQLKAAVTAKM